MSDTPRTDAARQDEHDPYMAVASECAKLEPELNVANDRIHRLEELGNELRECANQIGYTSSHEIKWLKRAGLAVKAWDKEAKP